MNLFLTSNIGGIKKVNETKVPIEFSNENNFLNNLKKVVKDYNKFVLIASNPSDAIQNDRFLELDKAALELSEMKFENYLVLDDRNKQEVNNLLSDVSLIFLCGGNTFQQNKFFNEIDLKKYLEGIDCCIVGISAGAINCADIVFNSPESKSDLENPEILKGLSLTTINVEPHFNPYSDNSIQIDSILNQSYHRDIYGIPDGTYIFNGIIYGRCYRVRDGKIEQICSDEEIGNLDF